MQPRRALHGQCIGVHHLYDIRSLGHPSPRYVELGKAGPVHWVASGVLLLLGL